MDSVKDVISVIRPTSFLLTVDIKNAFVSVPRFFVQLLKSLLSHSKNFGIIVVCYIDARFFLAPSAADLKARVQCVIHVFA